MPVVNERVLLPRGGFAGVGSRDLPPVGEQAIVDLVRRSAAFWRGEGGEGWGEGEGGEGWGGGGGGGLGEDLDHDDDARLPEFGQPGYQTP